MKPEQVHIVVLDFVRDLHGSSATLRAESTLDEIGIDSMSLVDLLFKLEREFDITIPDDGLPRIATVGDLVAAVSESAN
jgi:acyl carrier protein